ncbi:MAG TPA: hypothetical protein PL196_04550, partial [Burkholderiaceae bacterium]|nr:hypothetical protein [Burkholderiaceae bacterium]
MGCSARGGARQPPATQSGASTMSFTILRAGTLAALVFFPAAWAQADTLTAEVVGKVYVTGLSADGKVAVGQTTDNYETFRWQTGGRVTRLGRSTLDALSIISGSPAVSADGKVIASTILSDDGTFSTAARWTQAGGWQVLTGLPPGGGLMDMGAIRQVDPLDAFADLRRRGDDPRGAAVDDELHRSEARVGGVPELEAGELLADRLVVVGAERRARAGAAAQDDAAVAVAPVGPRSPRHFLGVPALPGGVLEADVRVRHVRLRDEHEAVARVAEPELEQTAD